jgi:hypothetical protein
VVPVSFAAVPPLKIRRGADWAQNYTWGDDSLVGWTALAVFTFQTPQQYEATPTLGAAGLITLSIPGAHSLEWPETYPLGRWRPVGTWALSLVSPTGVKYSPFGGPVHLLS